MKKTKYQEFYDKLIEQQKKLTKDSTNKTKPVDYSTIPELQKIDNKPIEEIINQKHWTCKDLGILFFYTGLSSYLQEENRKVYYYDKEKAKKELERPGNQKDLYVIDGYNLLYNWLIKNADYTSAIIQNRTGKYNYLMGKLRDIYFTEQCYLVYHIPTTKEEPQETIELKRNHYKKFFEPFSVLRYSSNNKNYIKRIENIKGAIKETISSYYFLLGWNKLLDILASFYNLPDLDIFKYKQINFIPEEFETYNKLYRLLNKKIRETRYIDSKGNTDDIMHNLRVSLFEQVFKPLDYSLPLKEERILKAYKLLNFTDFNVFEFQNNELLRLLCYRD